MEHWVKVEPDIRVYVNDINPQGKNPVLFLHGWPANHKMFEYQYNALLARDYRCIGMDMRGFGQSDKPTYGYGYDRLSDDVRAVIATLNLKGITLAGHSTGGAVVIRYAARYGAYGVSRLALFAAAAPSLIRREDFPYGLPRERVDGIINATYADRPQMLHDFGEMFFYKKVTPSFANWFFLMGLEAASWSTVAVAKTWLAETLFTDLTQIYVPTLILHGVHDQIVPYPLAEVQHKGIVNSKLVPFENSGHGLFYDQMDQFNHELIEFIR